LKSFSFFLQAELEQALREAQKSFSQFNHKGIKLDEHNARILTKSHNYRLGFHQQHQQQQQHLQKSNLEKRRGFLFSFVAAKARQAARKRKIEGLADRTEI